MFNKPRPRSRHHEQNHTGSGRFASIRQLVGFTLRNAGYTVTEAPDGKAALELARKGKFDLIFTDVNMPGLDGIELTRSVRALPGWAGTPILILTTEASDEMKQKRQGRRRHRLVG